MKNIDWQMVLFVSVTVVHDYWLIWGLPRVYYWNIKDDDIDHKDKAA